MKAFFATFFAILAAAAVIISVLWSKSRLDAWEWTWRSYEAQLSAIVSSEHALNGASLDEAIMRLKRIEDNTPQVVDLEQRTVAVLEHKPFGLSLTASERKELAAVKEDLQKEVAKLKEGVLEHHSK